MYTHYKLLLLYFIFRKRVKSVENFFLLTYFMCIKKIIDRVY